MRVRITKSVVLEQPVEALIDQYVDVHLDDIVEGFFRQADDLQRGRRMNLMVSESAVGGAVGELNALVDAITTVLSKISDDRIAALTSEMREHHRSRLIAQSDRYRSQEVETAADP